jgi:hypothetical protein
MSSSFRYTSSGPFTGDAEDGEEEDEEAEEERCRIPRGKDRLTWLIENRTRSRRPISHFILIFYLHYFILFKFNARSPGAPGALVMLGRFIYFQ